MVAAEESEPFCPEELIEMKHVTYRQAALAAAAMLVVVGLSQPPAASADPYQLPIATSGPVSAVPAIAPGTRSMQELAQQVGLGVFTGSDWRVGTVRHIVLLRYAPHTTPGQRAEVTARFLHLALDSRRPDGRRVVQSIETGAQNSGEGAGQGFEQAFLVTFRSEGDRNFYVGRPVVNDPAYFDPAHEAFKAFAAPYLAGLLVFDYDIAATAEPVKSAPPHRSPAHRR